VTRKNVLSIPRVNDTLDTFAGSLWFSTFNVKSGYWQVKVAEELPGESSLLHARRPV